MDGDLKRAPGCFALIPASRGAAPLMGAGPGPGPGPGSGHVRVRVQQRKGREMLQQRDAGAEEGQRDAPSVGAAATLSSPLLSPSQCAPAYRMANVTQFIESYLLLN